MELVGTFGMAGWILERVQNEGVGFIDHGIGIGKLSSRPSIHVYDPVSRRMLLIQGVKTVTPMLSMPMLFIPMSSDANSYFQGSSIPSHGKSSSSSPSNASYAIYNCSDFFSISLPKASSLSFNANLFRFPIAASCLMYAF